MKRKKSWYSTFSTASAETFNLGYYVWLIVIVLLGHPNFFQLANVMFNIDGLKDIGYRYF